MHIKLKDDWVITRNSNNIILGRARTRNVKDSDETEEVIVPVGYYSTPVSALQGYMKYEVRDSSVMSLIELESHYNRLLEGLAKDLKVYVSEQNKIELLEQEIVKLKNQVEVLKKKAK